VPLRFKKLRDVAEMPYDWHRGIFNSQILVYKVVLVVVVS